ncbi:MAG TPA: cyclic nucleotide-binding domain-containing protein [Desulfuromonadales bacterium]|nr:cyclic nucleotide-binding domain-containing protein [Desulfuromonadales bacterium]
MPSLDLDKWRLFADLAADDVTLIRAACEERILIAQEELFREGDAGDSLWIVQSGRVDVFKNIKADMDRSLALLGPGDVIGEMSFIDQSRRSAGARTTEPGEFLVLTRQAFDSLQKEHPSIAAGFYRNLASILATRVRNTLELYRESVAFSIEATGAGRLNLMALSEDLRNVSLHLTGGTFLNGRILQMDQSAVGYTIIFREKSGKLAIIPYHAIMRIELESH